MKKPNVLLWILRIVTAAILLGAFWGKVTAAPGPVAAFTELGMEPTGRIIIAVLELVAAIFILVPPLIATGALLGFAIMLGAFIAHVTVLGIVVGDDGGMLFGLSLVIMFTSLWAMHVYRKNLPLFGDTM